MKTDQRLKLMSFQITPTATDNGVILHRQKVHAMLRFEIPRKL